MTFYSYDLRIHFESIVIMQDVDDYGVVRKIFALAPNYVWRICKKPRSEHLDRGFSLKGAHYA